MPRSSCAVLFVAALFVAVPAAAQEAPAPAKPKLNFAPVSFMPSPIERGAPVRFDVKPNIAAPETSSRPSVLMTSLYATTALMQGLDAHSTMKAINAGASEKNPLMSYLTSHPPAFVALKTGAAASLIYASSRLAKRNKTHAVIALVAVNSAYVIIATHNYRVANSLR